MTTVRIQTILIFPASTLIHLSHEHGNSKNRKSLEICLSVNSLETFINYQMQFRDSILILSM